MVRGECVITNHYHPHCHPPSHPPPPSLSPIALIPTRESWLGDPGMGLQLVGDGFWEMTTPTANQLRALREMLLKAGYVPDTHEVRDCCFLMSYV